MNTLPLITYLALNEGSHDVVALVTVVLDNGQLRQDAGGAGDHTTCADQLVQVELSAMGRAEAVSWAD